MAEQIDLAGLSRTQLDQHAAQKMATIAQCQAGVAAAQAEVSRLQAIIYQCQLNASTIQALIGQQQMDELHSSKNGGGVEELIQETKVRK